MTPTEVKGLEFEDVFVYNFFTDSPSNTNWDSVREYYLEKGSQEMEVSSKKTGIVQTTFEQMENKHLHVIGFNEERDKILCSELKTLYMICMTEINQCS